MIHECDDPRDYSVRTDADDWVEERHRRHLERHEDDQDCYCYGEAADLATSLRDATPGASEVQRADHR